MLWILTLRFRGSERSLQIFTCWLVWGPSQTPEICNTDWLIVSHWQILLHLFACEACWFCSHLGFGVFQNVVVAIWPAQDSECDFAAGKVKGLGDVLRIFLGWRCSLFALKMLLLFASLRLPFSCCGWVPLGVWSGRRCAWHQVMGNRSPASYRMRLMLGNGSFNFRTVRPSNKFQISFAKAVLEARRACVAVKARRNERNCFEKRSSVCQRVHWAYEPCSRSAIKLDQGNAREKSARLPFESVVRCGSTLPCCWFHQLLQPWVDPPPWCSGDLVLFHRETWQRTSRCTIFHRQPLVWANGEKGRLQRWIRTRLGFKDARRSSLGNEERSWWSPVHCHPLENRRKARKSLGWKFSQEVFHHSNILSWGFCLWAEERSTTLEKQEVQWFERRWNSDICILPGANLTPNMAERFLLEPSVETQFPHQE